MPIFDQGYQHWRGSLSGHPWRWLAIARHGVRVQSKNRFLRILLLVSWLPALVLIAALVVWGMVEQGSETFLGILRALLPADMLLDPRAFRTTWWVLAYLYFFDYQLIFIMMLVLLAGPGLISRDLRFNALPLYFSRPLTRLDYYLGKLGVIGALVLAVAIVPALVAYVAGVCFSFDGSVFEDTYHILFAILAYGLVITLSAGTLILALSSLSKRSIYVGITWAAVWLMSGAVANILIEINREGGRRASRPGQTVANQAEQSEALRSDWRPVISYVTNVTRIGEALFDADEAWVKVGAAFEKSRTALGGFGRPVAGLGANNAAEINERRFADRKALQYPWQWSAGVLAGLLGLSSWILLRRVKSLDRLK